MNGVLVGPKDYNPDQLAEQLIWMGCLGRDMAPSYEKAGHKTLVAGLDGQSVGHILPGRGVYVDANLSKMGIHRRLPFVYERDPFLRLFERLHYDERGALTTYDGILSARAGGKADDTVAVRNSITMAAGFWYDSWKAGGGSGAGAPLATTPPTDEKLDRSSAGSLSLGLSNPGGSDKKYLVSLGCSFGSAHNFAILGDKLLDSGSYRLSVTSAETITTPKTIDRNYSPGNIGVGVQIIAPVTTARATPGAGTWTVQYTDDLGNLVNSPANALPATADPVDRLLAHQNVANPFVQLNSASLGAKALKQATRAAAADTTGVAGLHLFFPLIFIPALGTSNVYIERDLPSDLSGLIELANLSQVIGALNMLVYANAASMGGMILFVRTCAG